MTHGSAPPAPAGLGRLGTGVQVDALAPVLIPQFSGANPLTRCAKIAAGPACTLFIDAQGMVLLCGKWKVSGDGSSGQVSSEGRVFFALSLSLSLSLLFFT